MEITIYTLHITRNSSHPFMKIIIIVIIMKRLQNTSSFHKKHLIIIIMTKTKRNQFDSVDLYGVYFVNQDKLSLYAFIPFFHSVTLNEIRNDK